MTRFALIPAVLMITAACGTAPDGEFTHVSSTWSDTRGMVFTDDDTAEVGMGGATCQVDVSNGNIGIDTDVAMDDDNVVDEDGGLVMVVGDDSLYGYNPRGWGDSDILLETDGLVDGAFVDGGLVGVSVDGNGVGIDWTGDLTGSTSVPGATAQGLTFDTVNGTVFVQGEDGIVAAGPDGSETIGQGELMVWDSTAEVLYVADFEGFELRGLEADGGLRFATELPGAVHSIEALGTRGQAIALVERDGGGELLTIDGFTGEVVTSMNTPGAANEMATSESGDTIAIVTRNQVHFLRDR